MYYVKMIDTFLSGWGPCEGKDNLLVFEVPTKEIAEIVASNAEKRTDMKNVNIVTTKPYHENRFYISFKPYEPDGSYKQWYKKGAF